jgi:MFS family permease
MPECEPAQGLLVLPMALAGAVWQLLLLRAGMGLCLGVAFPVVSALLSLITPADRRGAAYGLLASAELGGFATGPLVGGVVGAAAGLRSVFLVTAVVLLVVAAVVALRVREPAAAAGAAGGEAAEETAEQEPSPAA